MSASNCARRRARLVFRAGRGRDDAGDCASGCARADAILFDGTLFTDDEMIAQRHRRKRPAAAWATCRSTATDGSLAALDGLTARQHLHPHQQHQSDPDRRLAASAARSRRRAGKSPRTAWRSCCEAAHAGRAGSRAARDRRASAITVCIRSITLLHGGNARKGQVQAWALNRYYYQAMIPIKDASLIARCDDPASGANGARGWSTMTAKRKATAASRAGSS